MISDPIRSDQISEIILLPTAGKANLEKFFFFLRLKSKKRDHWSRNTFTFVFNLSPNCALFFLGIRYLTDIWSDIRSNPIWSDIWSDRIWGYPIKSDNNRSDKNGNYLIWYLIRIIWSDPSLTRNTFPKNKGGTGGVNFHYHNITNLF